MLAMNLQATGGNGKPKERMHKTRTDSRTRQSNGFDDVNVHEHAQTNHARKQEINSYLFLYSSSLNVNK